MKIREITMPLRVQILEREDGWTVLLMTTNLAVWNWPNASFSLIANSRGGRASFWRSEKKAA